MRGRQFLPNNLSRPIHGVVFDFDGTLYGDANLWTKLIVQTLGEFNVSVSQKQALEKAESMIADSTFYNISGIAIGLVRENGILERDLDVRRRFLENLDVIMDRDGPDPRLVETLHQLHTSKVRMGIVTFQRMQRLRRRLDVWKLSSFFASLVTPDDVPEFKPSPLPFTRCTAELRLSPENCVMIGDEPVDMIGSKKAGMFAVGLPNGFFTAKQLSSAGADLNIRSIRELPGMVLAAR